MNWYQKAKGVPLGLRFAMDEYDVQEIISGAPGRVLSEFRYRKPGERQWWSTVPVETLQHIWNQYVSGFLPEQSEVVIDQVAEKFIWNVAQLYGNTVLYGHTSLNPDEYAEDMELDPISQEEYDSDIEEYMYNEAHGNICISDYAMEPLIQDCLDLSNATTPEEKVLILDRMINRIHMRGNLAALFVEGGVQSLDHLSESPEERNKREAEEERHRMWDGE